tara:strand:+ start:1132 stop:2577 length:1446 start_codon:yes stop_codon:yes gene_type:complete
MNKTLKSLTRKLMRSETVPDISISGLKFNSAHISKGDLFMAIPGNIHDGHDYIHDAIANGASAILSNGRDLGALQIPQIKVANPRRAASLIAAEFYDHPSRDLQITGITGTNGKTTTTFLLASILSHAGQKTAQIGTLGLIAEGFEQIKSLTTPDAISIQKILSDLKYMGFSHVVMEVSSHALDQYRVSDVHFNMAIFTNLTREHLDYHGTMEAYFQSKARLFRMLQLDSTAIVNETDPSGIRIAGETNAPVLNYSRSNGASVHYQELEMGLSGIQGIIKAGNETYKVQSELLGEFNAENILAAVSGAHTLGIENSIIEKGISACSAIPGRMEPFTLKNGATALIDYAHTPDAYDKVLGTIKQLSQKETKILVVFGAGGDRDFTKRPEMAKVAELYANHCYVTPDNPRTEDPDQIAKEVISGFHSNRFTVFADRTKGLRTALAHSKKGDVVIVLGKGREEYQEIQGEKVFYSDLRIIKDYQ